MPAVFVTPPESGSPPLAPPAPDPPPLVAGPCSPLHPMTIAKAMPASATAARHRSGPHSADTHWWAERKREARAHMLVYCLDARPLQAKSIEANESSRNANSRVAFPVSFSRGRRRLNRHAEVACDRGPPDAGRSDPGHRHAKRTRTRLAFMDPIEGALSAQMRLPMQAERALLRRVGGAWLLVGRPARARTRYSRRCDRAHGARLHCKQAAGLQVSSRLPASIAARAPRQSPGFGVITYFAPVAFFA